MGKIHTRQHGFTIVELLIVIIVIGLLAAMAIVSYGGVRDRADTAKISSDFQVLEKAITAARVIESKTLREITLNTHSGGPCISKASGSNHATLPQSDGCWVTYNTTLDRISDAAGSDVRGLVDPWGRPYYIDENEGEFSYNMCSKDKIAVYGRPHVITVQTALTNARLVPNSLTQC